MKTFPNCQWMRSRCYGSIFQWDLAHANVDDSSKWILDKITLLQNLGDHSQEMVDYLFPSL